MFKRISGILLLLSALNAQAANIGVTVDRNPVNLNDSFQLLFSSDASPDDDPDFAPLEKDFIILNQSKSEQSSWINGTSSRTLQWTLTVMAKQAGELTVPPIAFGGDRSKAIQITVTQDNNEPQMHGSGGADLFLDIATTPPHPYVQAQVLYTVRVYRRVEIAQASLSEPDVKDAVLEKLGEDSNYRTEVKGETYVVTERKYALFPQKSGTLTIPPVELTAQVIESGGSRFDSFFNTPSTRTKRVVSKAVTLEVQAMPATFKGAQWLPAEQVLLQEQWSGAIDQAKTGEPLTRTLTFTVKGSTVGQLPDLGAVLTPVKSQSGGELKAYPDQPEIKELKQAGGITAVRQEKIALIPSQAGEYLLSAIEIPWWNTQTQTQEMARIPPQIIKAVSPVQQPLSSAMPMQTPRVSPLPTVSKKSPDINVGWMAAAIVSTLGWLLTVIYFWRKGKAGASQQSAPLYEMHLQTTLKALQKACHRNDPGAAKNALIAWSKERFNETNLGAVASLCEAPLQTEIRRLNDVLYARERQPWNGEQLWLALKHFEKNRTVQRPIPEALEKLYKI